MRGGEERGRCGSSSAALGGNGEAADLADNGVEERRWMELDATTLRGVAYRHNNLGRERRPW
jgi:hypothetical protein